MIEAFPRMLYNFVFAYRALSLLFIKSMMKYITYTISFVCIMMTCACVTEEDTPDRSLGPGDRVPYFSVVTNNGTAFSTQDIFSQISVITFFNTSCTDCQHELPELQKVYEECQNGDMPVTFVCIAREETEADIKAYWAQNALSLPYSAQKDRRIYNLFATSGIPRIYITTPSDNGPIIAVAYTDTAPPDAGTLLYKLHEIAATLE